MQSVTDGFSTPGKGLRLVSILAVVVLVYPAWSSAQPSEQSTDPLNSVMWREMHALLLNNQPVVFDDRVVVHAPASAEDSLNVPVKVDATALGKVKRLIVFADLNPIPRILEMEPNLIRPLISFNFKVQQATPLRAAALGADGVWHVGGVLLDAAGGGCTQPSVGSGSVDWSEQLGNVSARVWPNSEGQRVKLRLMHPMDTGLADSIPAFYIERIDLSNTEGQSLAVIHLYEPVAENPTLTLELVQRGEVHLSAMDNNGTHIQARVLTAM